jgi:hypothetical protein
MINQIHVSVKSSSIFLEEEFNWTIYGLLSGWRLTKPEWWCRSCTCRRKRRTRSRTWGRRLQRAVSWHCLHLVRNDGITDEVNNGVMWSDISWIKSPNSVNRILFISAPKWSLDAVSTVNYIIVWRANMLSFDRERIICQFPWQFLL